MKQLKQLFLLLATLSMWQARSQTFDTITGSISPNQVSPDGILDAVFDQYGNKYSLNDIKVGGARANSQGVQKTSALLCTSGYFNLFFETGSGMDGTTTAETDRRNVICQVFSDISAFINSPLSNLGNPNRVNIWVRDINQIVPGSATSGVLGLATAFYNVPQNTTAGFGGIADNEIWKTIHTGTDSYVNVASPLVTAGGVNSSGGTFYHGMMAFNFNNAGINWNTNLGLASSPAGLYDLYSVALHEVTHALGFASLINFNGLSKFGAGYNYYSHYDLFLRNNAGNQNLITNSGACSLYNYQFNPALTTAAVAPGGCVTTAGSADNTACNTAATYVGATTVPLYTPNCFEAPSSLSHFEDQCYPTAGAPYGNNLYFTMSNANGTGAAFTKRHLAPEERLVLCDLGYNTNSTFGSAANNNAFNYTTGTCAGISVAGINDGISGVGAYLYIGGASSNITIPGSILGNDNNAATFECLADVYDPAATLSATSGNSAASILFSSSVVGTHLLRYIPVSSTGQRGNITYIYVYVLSANCTPSACNIINNGGFESAVSCGQLASGSPAIDCWQPYICTPDLLTRGCVSPSGFNIPSSNSSPAADTWNGIGNDHLMRVLSNGGHYNESAQTLLNSPIVQNGSYVVNFRARLANNFFGTVYPAGYNAQLLIAGAPNLLASPGSIPTTALPTALTQLGTSVLVPNDNIWHYYTIPFTYLNATSLNNFIIMNSTGLNTSTTGLLNSIYLDDVRLTLASQAVSLTLPTTLCINQSLADLSSYLTPATAGGVFTGAGVTLAGGIYSFNAATAGAGNHTITYSFTNNLGCSISISSNINVVNSNINLTASASPNNVCASGPVTLTGTGAVTYVWNPGNISGSPVTVNPTASTTYVLTGTDVNGCQATANVGVTVTPLNISLTANPNPLCIGQSANITPSGASTYVLQPGNVPSTGAPFVVSPTSSTIYDVTGTDANGCTGTAQITINVQTCNNCTNCTSSLGTTLASGTLFNNTYCVNNNITVTGPVTILSSELKIGAGWQITIAPTGNLTIRSSHLYSCGNMWQGIVIQNGGKLTITNSLIEDAMVAVDVTGNTQTSTVFNFSNSTFNRNNIALNINGYTQAIATYPFSINNCVITCRNIPFTPNSLAFPSSAAIGAAATNAGAPFTNSVINNTTYSQSGTAAFLKAPFVANSKPTAGIRLTNVGVTQNPQTTAPTYYEFVLGGANSSNIIDNQRVGVDLIQSNFTTYNNIYQNMFTFGKGGSAGGVGINANAGEISNNRLRVTSVLSLSSGTGNKFVDCSRAINSVNYFEHIISFNDIRSSQVNTAPTTIINHRGEYGVKSTTNRFRIYNVSSNTIYNIQNGVIMDGTFGSLAIPTIPSSGQYAGKINIDNNTFNPQIGTSNISTNFIGDAIALSNVSSSYYPANAPYPIFQTANNTITKAYRGIAYKNWIRVNCIINSNVITLVNDPFIVNNLQYGIGMTKCAPANGQSSVRSNDVTGYGITNPKLYGIISNQSTGNLVNCNTVTNTTDGIEFAGACNGASFSLNTMNTNKYGFVLSNSGTTGPFGATNAATDNKWTGAWPTGVRYKTATITSSAIGNELWVRNSGAILNPNGSSINIPGTPTDLYYWAAGNTGTLKYVTAAPISLGCPIIIGGGGGNPPALSNFIQQLEQIALDQVNYAASQVNEARFINKANLLSMLKGDPSLTVGSPILQTFTATSVNTSRDKFATVEDQTAKGNLSTAGSVNASISPTISIESNHKDFYSTLLNYANQSLTTADSITIVNLSNGCPFTDGSVVYQARALYNVMFDTYQVFLDNCDENNSGTGSRLMKPEEKETKDLSSLFDAAIFPNPGTSDFNIATFGLTEGNVDITVCDMNGRVVYQNKLLVANALTNFSIDVKSGVYFVKIFDSTVNKTIIKKLVVQQ